MLEQKVQEEFQRILSQHSNNLSTTYQTHLVNSFRQDFTAIINHIRQQFPTNCTMSDISNILIAYIRQIISAFEIQMQQQHPQPNLFSTQQTNTVFGRPPTQQVSTVFGISDVSMFQTHQPVSSFYNTQSQVSQQPQPQEIEPMPKAPEKYTIGDGVIELFSNYTHEVNDIDATFDSRKIQFKQITLFPAVNDFNEAISRIKPIIKTNQPFIVQCSYREGVYVNIPPTVFAELYALYVDEGFVNAEPSESLSKRVIGVFIDYVNRINFGVGVTLTEFFVTQFKPLIGSFLVDPDDIASELVPNKIEDLMNFFEGDIYDEFCHYTHFGAIRDIIIKNVMINYIQPGNICDWSNIVDRADIVSCHRNLVSFDGYSMLNMATLTPEDLKDSLVSTAHGKMKDNDFFKKPLDFTVVRIPASMVYTNIIPNDLQYRFGGNQSFDAFTISEVTNIIEEAVWVTGVCIEKRLLVVVPDSYTRYVCNVSDIVDGTMRIAPAKIV